MQAKSDQALLQNKFQQSILELDAKEKEIKKKDVLIERAKQNEELMRSLQDQVKSLKENLETKDKRIER